MAEKDSLYIEGLEEAIEVLQDEISRLRNSNRVLRVVNSSLRRQQAVAHSNDETFKSFCAEEIVVDVT